MAVPDDATPSSLEMGLGLYIGDCLDSLPPAKRNLVRYFATEIAPHMVAIDDDSNGYRVLVLPAAEAYGSVLNAVLAASAYHMSHRMESSHRASQQAQSYYTQAINDLRHIPPGSVGNGNEQMLSILTIFVMLISTMITGCSDFPILYKMLTSLFKASSQGKSQDQAYLREFLVIQMRKFELYANPFIDEKQVPGDTEYTNFVTQGLTCLRRCAELHPEHAANLARTSDLISQAGLIYSLRARNELAKESSFRLVEEYKTSLARFSPTTAGWKVLIWATFIVAAESSDTTHRAFLLETLEEQYRRNGFGNLRTAMDMLRDVWNRGAEENWTKRLPQWKVFVM
ncbi:fungal-specific transcription factor domain-containing protein [Penicillium argentinense]|uniref:Fungal-specific transcription factor domain-containing protein n=1 Tax=Penicillium argentinense TaxID=1131581 RepID=A0A9W9G362_9EURO|nr:fungal-specific transcription factor domain-containing protein [Penicillium argentinense]KAJ5110810.1 fungal-specific transcription factor domain-containing protein [Penicillium argentinense]